MNSLTNLTYETYLQELNYENSPTGIHSHLQNLTYKTLPRNTILQKNSSTRTRLRQQTYENSLTKLSYISSTKILPRNTHLQKTQLRGLAYNNKPTRTHLLNLPTKTHLQDLTYGNKPTKTHLLNSCTKHTYKILSGNKHLQKTHLRGLGYDNKSTRTHLLNSCTKHTYKIK